MEQDLAKGRRELDRIASRRDSLADRERLIAQKETDLDVHRAAQAELLARTDDLERREAQLLGSRSRLAEEREELENEKAKLARTVVPAQPNQVHPTARGRSSDLYPSRSSRPQVRHHVHHGRPLRLGDEDHSGSRPPHRSDPENAGAAPAPLEVDHPQGARVQPPEPSSQVSQRDR